MIKKQIKKVDLSKCELESIGAFVFENFISRSEETELQTYMDSGDWVDSQSGRRKQDFGPKANFKGVVVAKTSTLKMLSKW